MRGKLFEYVVLYHPKDKKDAQGNVISEPSKILVAPTHVVGVDEKSVGIIVARKIPDEYLDKLDEIEIIVRPF